MPKKSKAQSLTQVITIAGHELTLGPASQMTVRQDIRRAIWIRKMDGATEEDALAYFGYGTLISSIVEGEPPSFDEYLELTKAEADKWYNAVAGLGYYSDPQNAQPS